MTGGRFRHPMLVASLVLATGLQIAVAVSSPVIARDGVTFIRIARELDDPVAAVRREAQHPGYPILIRAMLPIASVAESGTEAWELAARLASGSAGLACVVLIWGMTRSIYGPRVAGITALLAAGLPVLRRNAADALSDAPHLALYLAATWLLVEGVARRSAWRLGVAGLLSGAAFWVRPEGASVAVVGIGFLGLEALFRSGERLKLIRGAAALAAGVVLIAAPYVLLSGRLTDKIVQKANFPSFVAKFIPPATTAEPTASPAPSSTASVRPTGISVVAHASEAAEPLPTSATGYLRSAGRALRLFVNNAANSLHILLIPIAAALLFRLRPPMTWRAMPVTSALAAFHFLLLMLLYFLGGYMAGRHLLPLIVLAIPAAAAGIISVTERVKTRAYRTALRVAAAPAALIASTVAVGATPWTLKTEHAQWVAFRSAAEWIRDHEGAASRVFADSPYVTFYGGVAVRPTSELATASLAAKETALVVLGAAEELAANPAATEPRASAEIVWTSETPSGAVKIYRLTPALDLRNSCSVPADAAVVR